MRWLDRHRPAPGPRVTVHGDFRCGNFLVGPEGLRGVLDWELAHAGDPAEDIGWLCAPAWRFGGRGEVGGFGTLDELLGVVRRGRRRARWTAPGCTGGRCYATVKWAVICALQASAHLSGATRSVELAAIGRRVCESEWDLFTLLGRGPGRPRPRAGRHGQPGGTLREADGGRAGRGRPRVPRGRRHGAERRRGALRGAGGPQRAGHRRARARVGRDVAAAHAYRLRDLGISDDAALAAAIRAGDFDDRWEPVGAALAASARDQLLVANPSYLPAASA